MHIDHDQARAMARSAGTRSRRPWMPLLSALLELGQGRGELIRHSEQPWASVTFSGSKHRVRLAFTGSEAVAAGEELIDALPDYEFAIPDQLVADAAVVAVEHTALPELRLEIETELLLLEES